MSWRDLLNVQNVEKGFFRSSNSYGIPDIKKDENSDPIAKDAVIKASNSNATEALKANDEKTIEQSEVPRTGDINLWGYVILMIISAIAVIFILKGKSKQDEI